MCIQLVERYAGCGCLYYEHSVDPCSAINLLGHEICVKEIPIEYTCSYHSLRPHEASKLDVKKSQIYTGPNSGLGKSLQDNSSKDTVAVSSTPVVNASSELAVSMI